MEVVPFRDGGGAFLIRVVLSLVINLDIVAVVVGSDFFKTQNPSVPLAFSNSVLFWVLLWAIPGEFPLNVLVKFLEFFFHLTYVIDLSFMFFLFPYFTLKFFCFLWIQLLICPRIFSTDLLIVFFCYFGIVCFVCIALIFRALFFCRYLLIYLF